jgi:hypothetical protein
MAARALAVGAAVCVAAAAATAQTRSDWVHHRMIYVPAPDGRGSQRVLLTYPRRERLPRDAPQALPVLVALHGAGESVHPPSRACLAWSVDYHVDDAFAALLGGRPLREAYAGLVTDARLAAVTASLRARPFRGLVLVTPYTPNLLGEAPGSDAVRAYGDWLAGPVLAAVRREVLTVEGAASTGIDGVSLGGRLALEVGLAHPEAFGVVGAIQPALGPGVVEALGVQAARTLAGRPLRLLGSDEDPGLPALRALSSSLRRARVAHDLVVARGPHGYAFNRGPGSVELLFHHGDALARAGE